MRNPDDNPKNLLTRREAIRRVSVLLGGTALVGQAAMLAGCDDTTEARADAGHGGDALFTDADIERLGEIADTILPETDTPGAKEAGVGPFIALMVTDTYYPEDQKVFLDGLETLERECRDQHGTGFMAANAEQRLALLQRLDQEQLDYMWKKPQEAPTHYFRMLKELSLLGYFTSEIGYTKAMRYVETPGRWDPCAPLEPGDTIWADHA